MQDEISSAILRLAIFRLKNLLASLLRNVPTHSLDHNTLYQLVMKESKQNKYLNSLMMIVYRHHQKRMEKDCVDQASIKFLAELEIKAVIGQLINHKCEYTKREASKMQEEPKEDESAQLHVKNKDSTSQQAVCNNPWPDQDQSSIQEPEQAQSQEEPSCFEQSEEQGHFLFGDKAQLIEQIFSIENQLYGVGKVATALERRHPSQFSAEYRNYQRTHSKVPLCFFGRVHEEAEQMSDSLQGYFGNKIRGSYGGLCYVLSLNLLAIAVIVECEAQLITALYF